MTFHTANADVAADDQMLVVIIIVERLVSLGLTFRQAHGLAEGLVGRMVCEGKSWPRWSPKIRTCRCPSRSPSWLGSNSSSLTRSVGSWAWARAVGSAGGVARLASPCECCDVVLRWLSPRCSRATMVRV
jgi:hypothetical protein